MTKSRARKTVVLGISLVVSGLLWSPLGSQLVEITPKDPAEIGQDQSRVMGGDTGPSVLYTSHLFDNKADKEKLLYWVHLWSFGGSDGVPLHRRWVRFPP